MMNGFEGGPDGISDDEYSSTKHRAQATSHDPSPLIPCHQSSHLPEVAAAERSSWELIEIPLGEDLPAHLRLRKSFTAGEAFQERVTITVPEPGYYFVMATVIQQSEDVGMSDEGRVIGTGAGREMWLWIDEHGGRITDRFDPGLFTEGTRRVRGPISSENKPPRIRTGDAVITCSLLPAGGFTVGTYGCRIEALLQQHLSQSA